MKAWIFRRYGGPEVLEWAELPEPVPRKGEIVVRVVAAALNPLDWKLRAGQYRFMTAGRLPRGVGSIMRCWSSRSGGRDTPDAWRPGRGQAESFDLAPWCDGRARVRDPGHAALKPPSLSFADGAALPGAGMTAVQSLRDARLAAGSACS